MSEDMDEVKPGRFSQHKIILLVAGASLTAIVLTIVSLALYDWSGASLLDLSRPGYRSVQKDANVTERFEGFSATGEINKNVLDDFRKMYEERSSRLQKVDAFGGKVLDNSTLGIDDPATLLQ